MKIGIIGAGRIGSTLTRRLTALGHHVWVANSRGPETLTDLAAETGATAASADDAARGAELVVITIPMKNFPKLPEGLLDEVAEGAAIVDTGNYYPQRDGRIDAIEEGTTETRWAEQQVGWPLIKAFNTIHSQHLMDLGKPAGAHGRIALPVAGDDEAAKARVIQIVDELGFDPVDAGGLDDSWRQQPGTPVYGADLDAEGVKRALAEARPERPAALRG